MTNDEKIQALEFLLREQIKWYKDCESSEDYDDSYTYDTSEEQYDRSTCCEILTILSK